MVEHLTPTEIYQKKKDAFVKASNNEREKQLNEDYNQFLDFSSEIEFDERFDEERGRFIDEHKVVGSVTTGMPRLDRSVPEHMRANTKMQREANRGRLMETYKKTVLEHEY